MRIKKTQRNKNKINPKIKIKKLGWKNNAATSRLCPTRLLDGRKVHRCFINTIRSLSSSSFLLFLFFCQNHYNLFSLLLLYSFPLLFLIFYSFSPSSLLFPFFFYQNSLYALLFLLVYSFFLSLLCLPKQNNFTISFSSILFLLPFFSSSAKTITIFLQPPSPHRLLFLSSYSYLCLCL